MPVRPSSKAPEPPATGRGKYLASGLTIGQVARELGVTQYRVLELEKSGDLNPGRDEKHHRRYRAAEVAALAAKRRAIENNADMGEGAMEARVLGLIESGASNAEIVQETRASIASVSRMRAAARGTEDESEQIALRTKVERELEEERAARNAQWSARRKERNDEQRRR